LPARSGPRRRELESVRGCSRTEVFYEAPHRIRETVQDIVAVLGPERQIVIARELTKLHEEFVRGTAAEVLKIIVDRGELKGEITLLIGPASERQTIPSTTSLRERVAELMKSESIDEKSALKKVAKERGMSKSEAYRELQRNK
jgi:16S rRNA (cytidine1402-2'-O)-methyltransferase